MTPMCHVDTGLVVGWAVASIDCAGTAVAIRYYSTSGSLVGTTKPSTWEFCQTKGIAGTIDTIVQMTQAAYDALPATDPNTLYLIVG